MNDEVGLSKAIAVAVPELDISGFTWQILPAGASRITWLGKNQQGEPKLIVRLNTPGAIDSQAILIEAELIKAAHAIGVPSPKVYGSGLGTGLLQHGFVIMEFLAGETLPPKILADPELAATRAGLAGQCGEILAAIHRIDPAGIPELPDQDDLTYWTEQLHQIPGEHPVLELAAKWLADHRPPPRPKTLVHGDFRHGNFIIDTTGIKAVLDWELAHLGDPIEDLGWLLVKAWRFGYPLPVGGFGEVADLVNSYQAASGLKVSTEELVWAEILGTFRWGVICLFQANRHLSGATQSVELAAIGRRVTEPEWDLCQLLEKVI